MTRVRAMQLTGLLVIFILVGWGIGAVVTAHLTPDDLNAVRDVASDRAAAATVVAHVFSWIASGFVIFPAAVICCVALYRRRHWASALAVAFSTVGVQIIIDLDKLLVGRRRPPLRHLDHVTGRSFPSGHTGQTAAFCAVLLIEGFMLGAPRRLMSVATVGGGILIACVGFSRVYLGVHYPSDVVAGAVLGISWSLVASRLAHRWSPADDRVETASGTAAQPPLLSRGRPPSTAS